MTFPLSLQASDWPPVLALRGYIAPSWFGMHMTSPDSLCMQLDMGYVEIILAAAAVLLVVRDTWLCRNDVF